MEKLYLFLKTLHLQPIYNKYDNEISCLYFHINKFKNLYKVAVTKDINKWSIYYFKHINSVKDFIFCNY